MHSCVMFMHPGGSDAGRHTANLLVGRDVWLPAPCQSAHTREVKQLLIRVIAAKDRALA